MKKKKKKKLNKKKVIREINGNKNILTIIVKYIHEKKEKKNLEKI